jgi:hypothetical protein
MKEQVADPQEDGSEEMKTCKGGCNARGVVTVIAS